MSFKIKRNETIEDISKEELSQIPHKMADGIAIPLSQEEIDTRRAEEEFWAIEKAKPKPPTLEEKVDALIQQALEGKADKLEAVRTKINAAKGA